MTMEAQWNGYRAEEFSFCGRKAIAVLPHEGRKTGDWALKTEYWGAFPNAELALLERGFTLAFLQNRTRFATKEECAEKANFCSFVSERYGLREKCALVGMSCGGAHALTFAGLYPEKAACLYLDAPVVSYLSYPGRFGDPECESVWEKEFVLAYPGVRRMDLLSFGNHPVSRVQTLIDRKIPVLLVYGTQDATVPYDENGRLLEEAYEGYPGLLTVLPCALRGHHPHGLADPAPIADFIEAACRAARA